MFKCIYAPLTIAKCPLVNEYCICKVRNTTRCKLSGTYGSRNSDFCCKEPEEISLSWKIQLSLLQDMRRVEKGNSQGVIGGLFPSASF